MGVATSGGARAAAVPRNRRVNLPHGGEQMIYGRGFARDGEGSSQRAPSRATMGAEAQEL